MFEGFAGLNGSWLIKNDRGDEIAVCHRVRVRWTDGKPHYDDHFFYNKDGSDTAKYTAWMNAIHEKRFVAVQKGKTDSDGFEGLSRRELFARVPVSDVKAVRETGCVHVTFGIDDTNGTLERNRPFDRDVEHTRAQLAIWMSKATAEMPEGDRRIKPEFERAMRQYALIKGNKRKGRIPAMVNRHGYVGTVERKMEDEDAEATEPFKLLAGAGQSEQSFESIVVNNPDLFSTTAFNVASKRLAAVQSQADEGNRRAHFLKLAANAFYTTEASGKTRNITVKEKQFGFNTTGQMADHLDECWERQNGKCALTGVPMEYQKEGHDWNASPDRIVSTDGGDYCVENVQLVGKMVNMMKRDMSDEKFRAIITRIVEAA